LDNVIAPVLPTGLAETSATAAGNCWRQLAWQAASSRCPPGCLAGSSSVTIIIATHDPQIAARCERLIRLRDGAAVDDIDSRTDIALRKLSAGLGSSANGIDGLLAADEA
jgi:hypothetical protein